MPLKILILSKIRTISQKINHPTYVSGAANDWQIIKLSTPLDFNANVQPACLPDSTDYMASSIGDKCYVSGWGSTKHYGAQGTQSSKLKFTEMITKSHYWCNEKSICASNPKGDTVCSGDSGGPFVCNVNGKAVSGGAVSFTETAAGSLCKVGGVSGYFRTAYVLDWVKQNMVSSND